jgi:hypothetical protein
LWGWTAWGFTGNERHLFPGVAAVALAIVGCAWRPRRLVLIYLALTILAVELSLGLNGTLYRWLYDHFFAFRGFRAPARFAILACCAMSVLAGFGFLFLERLLAKIPARRLLLVAALIAIGVDSGSSPLELAEQTTKVPPVYRYLQGAPRYVVTEFPVENYNPTYMFWSTYHWHSLINGYSGYQPRDVNDTMTHADVSRRRIGGAAAAAAGALRPGAQGVLSPGRLREPHVRDRAAARVDPVRTLS